MATLTTILGTDTITSSRTVINQNFTNLNTDKVETSVLDVDTTLASNSDLKVATQKAVKAYVDALGGLTFLVPTGAIFPYGAVTAPINFLLCNGTAVSRATYSTLFTIIGTNYGTGNGSTTFNLPDLQGRFPLGYAGTAPTKLFTFSSRTSNVVTVTGADNHTNNENQTGQAVLYTAASGAMTGLTHNTTYFLIRITATSFSLATTLANAVAGTVIALSSDGVGAQTFGVVYTARSLAQTGGEENHALTVAELPSHSHSALSQNATGALVGGVTNAGTSAQTGTAGSSTSHNIMPLFTVVNYIIKI